MYLVFQMGSGCPESNSLIANELGALGLRHEVKEATGNFSPRLYANDELIAEGIREVRVQVDAIRQGLGTVPPNALRRLTPALVGT